MAKRKPVHDGSFAKLFGPDQILVLCRDDDDGDPAIELMISMGEGATTSVVLSYKSDDYAKRDEQFHLINEAAARKHMDPIRKMSAPLFGK